jgi:hypothetical protein
MEKVRQFTVSILLVFLLGACASKENDQELPEESTEETEITLPEPKYLDNQVSGLWKVQLSPAKKEKIEFIKHQFDTSGVWFMSFKFVGDSAEATGGGVWSYDKISEQLVTLTLPDSVAEIYQVLDLNAKKMLLETNDGVEITYMR